MLPSTAATQQAVVYFTILVVCEVIMLIFSLIIHQSSNIFNTIIRVLMLVVAHCLKGISWAAFYCVFAFLGTLYLFDPVGLWITGRSNSLTQILIPNKKHIMLFLSSSSSSLLVLLILVIYLKSRLKVISIINFMTIIRCSIIKKTLQTINICIELQNLMPIDKNNQKKIDFNSSQDKLIL